MPQGIAQLSKGVTIFHEDDSDCPDCLICYTTDGTYGIYIHDGGSSRLDIDYCPWCGSKLKLMVN